MSQQNPREFYCPLTNCLMRDPVMTVDGFCFERSAILQWFGKGNKNNPITFIELESLRLISNNPLRSIIARFPTYLEQINELNSRCAELEEQIQNLRLSGSGSGLGSRKPEERQPYEHRYNLSIKDTKVKDNSAIIVEKYYDTAAATIVNLPNLEAIAEAAISITSIILCYPAVQN